MTTVIAVTRYGRDEPCGICGLPLAEGEPVALTRDDDHGHDWQHVRCLISSLPKGTTRND